MLREIATLLASVGTFSFVSHYVTGVLPAGTRLEARLSVPTGSRISHAGDPIEATVIAPVFGDGQLLMEQSFGESWRPYSGWGWD